MPYSTGLGSPIRLPWVWVGVIAGGLSCRGRRSFTPGRVSGGSSSGVGARVPALGAKPLQPLKS